jgi:osmotically inducible lipoprotein OsmB
MQKTAFAALALATTLLAGCGQTTGEQVLFGGASGALGAAVLDVNPVAGAAVGAGANYLYCEANPGVCN